MRRVSTILFHFVLFICVTHASPAPALLPPISHNPSAGMYARRSAATHRRGTTIFFTGVVLSLLRSRLADVVVMP